MHERAQCPAKDQTCNKCGKQGHVKTACKSLAKVGGVSTDLGEEDTAFLGAIGAESDSDESWAINLTLQGTPVTLQLHTRAEVTVVSDKMWRDVGQPGLTCSDRILRGPDKHIIPTLGRFAGTFANRDSQADSDVYVVKKLAKSLLSRPTIQAGLIKRIAAIRQQLLNTREQFPSLFEGLGKLEGDYKIELREDAQPFALVTPRRVAISLLKSVQQELQLMETLGVIAKVNQPTD